MAMTASQHQRLSDHLFPGDGLEAAAVLVCNQGTGRRHQRLVVADIVLLPHRRSERRKDFVSWPFADHLDPDRITSIDRNGQSIVTIHSHPTGNPRFSELDDRTDRELLESVSSWFDDGRMHGSAIMTPDLAVRARTLGADGNFIEASAVSSVGEDVQIWKRGCQPAKSNASRSASTPSAAIPVASVEEHETRVAQAFGRGTLDLLRSLRVGVVGCSGTGSVVIELLVRNCVGAIVMVDDDVIEPKNLNRIVNASMDDALAGRPKVDALRQAVERMGFGTSVDAHRCLTDSQEAVAALVDCDVLFGCVDSASGRYHLDCLASAYCLPYFDVGVNLDADGEGGLADADAVAHYVHPEGSSLLSRGAYTMEQVTAENWRRHDPDHYKRQRIAGYLEEVGEDQPAVISVNMQAACLAFNDFMARVHSYRFDRNRDFATQRLRLVHGAYDATVDTGGPHPLFRKYMGMGDASVLVQNNIVQ